MTEVLDQYRRLLESIDGWFKTAQNRFPDEMQCGLGCSGCCRGFFDITLLDAALVSDGFHRLPADTRARVRLRADARLAELQKKWPGFKAPFLLNGMPDSEWTEMPEDDETACPFLDNGRCLVYTYRPMTCRLHGLPNIDISGESFSDAFCTLNFNGLNPLTEPELRWGFRAAFQKEIAIFSAFTTELTGTTWTELDTLLPLVPLIEFSHTDWRNLELYVLPGSTEQDK